MKLDIPSALIVLSGIVTMVIGLTEAHPTAALAGCVMVLFGALVIRFPPEEVGR